MMKDKQSPVGRFAPTPSGRMHLGNVWAALLSWLSTRSQGGAWILRMEDLDTQRTGESYARQIREDLLWLGLAWDEETPAQSTRSAVYQQYFDILDRQNLLYPCFCSRSQLHSVNAPHLSDGTYVYPGTCRDLTGKERAAFERNGAWRLRVPDEIWSFSDLCQGHYQQNLAAECGDFVLRRADGVYVYQLAVTVDDALSGVTEVVRGADLLSSTPRQMYLQTLFGFPHPAYGHIPMLLSVDGRRLSKRDRDMDLGQLQLHLSPEALIGHLATAAGLLDKPEPISAKELSCIFSWDKVKKQDITLSLFEA